MDDGQTQKPAPFPPGKLSRWSAAAWLLMPLLACVVCLALTVFALTPEPSALVPIPVTGRPRAIPPTPPAELFPAPAAEQEVPPGVPTLAPGLWYQAEMQRRLQNCYSSFQEFYLLEQIAYHEPGMIHNEEWRGGVEIAVQTFRSDCELLGSLPHPPHSFREIDSWLKLAAAEVGPAADSFSHMVEQEDPTAIYRTIAHLTNFIEYTRNAESALELLSERKEL
jgi:hypothetical protein